MLPTAACLPEHGVPRTAKHLSLCKWVHKEGSLQGWAACRSKLCKRLSPAFSRLQLILASGSGAETGNGQVMFPFTREIKGAIKT